MKATEYQRSSREQGVTPLCTPSARDLCSAGKPRWTAGFGHVAGAKQFWPAPRRRSARRDRRGEPIVRKYEEEAKVLVIQIAGLEAALWVRAGAEDRVQVREVAEAHLRADLALSPLTPVESQADR